MSKRISLEFLEKTKYTHLTPSPQTQGIKQPPLEAPPNKTLPIFDLPKPTDITINPITLRESIEKRTSIRNYSNKPLTIHELSWLLWATQGVKQVVPRPSTLRNVPSAGARHAIDTYLLLNKVENLEQGLYRYIALSHQLEQINIDNDIANKIYDSCLRQNMIKNSAITFIWTTDFYRMTWRYGERGMRYIHLDAGHVCQNLYLAAAAINSGVCAIAAFDDDNLNTTLGLDGENNFTVYIATLGKK